jgi:protoporphyrinogen oxidase
MLSSRNAPPGAGSIQAEVYFSDKYKPFSGAPEDWIEPVIRDLRKCGLLRDSDTILSRKAIFLKYANIIFDLERAAALKKVQAYLDDLGIACCGRYGEWGYLWTDDAFKSGELAAERALSMLVAST